ncbi:DUF6531 domain-containing protein [Pseudomonas paraeruginosa]
MRIRLPRPGLLARRYISNAPIEMDKIKPTHFAITYTSPPSKYSKSKFFLFLTAGALGLTGSFYVAAENFYWTGETYGLGADKRIDKNTKYENPEQICNIIRSYLQKSNWVEGVRPEFISEERGNCIAYGNFAGKHQEGIFGFFWKLGNDCPAGKTYNSNSGECTTQNTYIPEISCPPTPTTLAGNPIDISNGNKHQKIVDIRTNNSSSTPIFSRYYNSNDGLWRHNYSAHLIITEWSIRLIDESGAETFFKREKEIANTPAAPELKASKSDETWTIRRTSGDELTFSENGNLLAIRKKGVTTSIHREDKTLIIKNDSDELLIVEDSLHQPVSATTKKHKLIYHYENGALLKTTKTKGNLSVDQTYTYKENTVPRLLTGIIDESGVRYATWSYDPQGRAISSEHANGAEKVTLAYNDDGSTTVTNEYGKQATYRFQVIQGIKRIVAIEGEPSPNCPSSNSTFTYDERGLLTSKRDNNGNLTTYQYNARGLETSRTEAVGTAQARTITTDWHPSLFLPVQVREPGRITRYQYDAEGRKTGETVTTR